MKKITYLILICLFFSACSSNKIALSPDFKNKKGKVGLLISLNSIEHNVYSNGGMVGYAVNSLNRDKYMDGLNYTESSLNTPLMMKEFYTRILNKLNKVVVIISDTTPIYTQEKYKPKVKQKGKKYASLDFCTMKDSLKVDYLFLIDFKYGLVSATTYGIETSRGSFVNATPELVDLSDNSFVYKNKYAKGIAISTKQDLNVPPEYRYLIESIKTVIDMYFSDEKVNLK